MSFAEVGGPGGEAGRGQEENKSLAWGTLYTSHLGNNQEELSRRRCPWDSAEGLGGDGWKPQVQALTATSGRAWAWDGALQPTHAQCTCCCPRAEKEGKVKGISRKAGESSGIQSKKVRGFGRRDWAVMLKQAKSYLSRKKKGIPCYLLTTNLPAASMSLNSLSWAPGLTHDCQSTSQNSPWLLPLQ